MQNASLPRGHASIRIQQYVGIITCMGLVLLRDNEMDREDCTCGEESSTWESQSATLYGVFHTWCISMGLTAHGLLRSSSTSVDILGHSKCDNSFSSGPFSKTHAGGRLLSIIYI